MNLFEQRNKLLFASVLFVLSLFNLSFAQNIGDTIQNYGFEDGVDSLGVPTGCVLGANDYNGNAEFVLDKTVFHTGAASGLIQGVDDNDLSLDPYLPNMDLVEEGATYTYSVWLKTEVTAGVFAVQITPQWDYYEYPGATTEWTEYTGEFVCTKDGESAVVIGLYGKGKIWIDDCKIVLKAKIFEVGETIFATGFEDGADSTGLPLVAAYINNWSGVVAVDVSNDAHTGVYSAKIYADPADGTIGGGFDISVGSHAQLAEYHLSIWIKTELTAGSAQIITAWDNARFFKVEGTTDWTKYEMDYIAPKAGEQFIRFHGQSAVGQILFDDLEIVMTKGGFEVPTDVVYNPGFEIPNDDGTAPIGWSPKPWGSGSTEIGFPGNVNARYIWDNVTFHSGAYSGKIQVTPADVEKGSMDAGWLTENVEFIAGGVYELSYWAKTNNFTRNTFRISVGYNNVNLTQTTENTDWVQVKDTLVFPTDQDDNSYRDQMRFRLSGATPADSMAEVWVDDVQFLLLGKLANQLDSILVLSGDNNSVNISWPSHPDITNPIYHVMMQPISEDGVFANNVLSNPGFDEPNDDGSAPKDWVMWNSTTEGSEAVAEFPASETFAGNFSVWLSEKDPANSNGIYARWEQTYNKSLLVQQNAYLYGAMVKYENVTTTQDSIIDETHPNGYYYSSGVTIFYDRYGFQFQNAALIKHGWSTPLGTSDGWEMISLPIGYDQAATRSKIGIGLGQGADGIAKGNLFVDNAFVVPFNEVTTTSATSITIEDVPADVKYFAVYVEDADGVFISSPASIGLVTTVTTVKDNSVIPTRFELSQNYPNPFNPSTVIAYSIPSVGDVKLSVFNVLGQEVALLANIKNQSAGNHQVTFNAANFASGIYFYRIITPGNVMTKKMMLIK